jgi:hypothetical protein
VSVWSPCLGLQPVVDLVRDRPFVAGLLAIALAASVASSAEAAGPQDAPQGQTVAAPAATPEPSIPGTAPDLVAQTGKQTRVGTVYNCGVPDEVPIFWARADHGSISIAVGKGPQCGRPSMTLAAIFYTPAPDFKGTDKIYVMGFLLEGRLDHTYTVLVK